MLSMPMRSPISFSTLARSSLSARLPVGMREPVGIMPMPDVLRWSQLQGWCRVSHVVRRYDTPLSRREGAVTVNPETVAVQHIIDKAPDRVGVVEFLARLHAPFLDLDIHGSIRSRREREVFLFQQPKKDV